MKRDNVSFIKFIHNLELTHKLYVTHFFGKLSFNLNAFFFTSWQSESLLFNNLFSFFSCSVTIGS